MVPCRGTFAGRGRETLPEGAIPLTGGNAPARRAGGGDAAQGRSGTLLRRRALAREDVAASLEHFLGALRTRRRHEIALGDTLKLKSFAIVRAAPESSRTGRPVAVPPLLASLAL